MLRTAIAFAAFFGFILPAVAQTDESWLEKPYQLQVNIQAEPHPLLTAEYLGRLERELRDTLQRDLGKTAVVEVVAESSRDPKKLQPLMREVAKQGWDALDKPSHPITGKKLHLLRLRYEDGEYLLDGRQVDGDTGLVGPLRRSRTGDRQWVARTASLMIGQDFGLTAAITGLTEQTALFQIRAAALGRPESIRVKDGEVFALSRIFRGPGGELLGRREENALLFVTGLNPDTGKCTGRVYTRYAASLKKGPTDRSTVGFRAIKLGTLRTPLQVRVVNQKTNDPVAGCEVVLYPGGFPNANKPGELTRAPEKLGATDSAGRISTANPIDHVCFARFQVGQVGVNIPIALFDDQPVTISLAGLEEADRLSEFTYFYKQWEQKALDVRNTIQTEYEAIGKLVAERKEKEILPRKEAMAARMKEDIADLKEGYAKLKEQAGPAGEAANRWLKSGQQYLKIFDDALLSLEAQIKEEKDPSPASKLVKEAQVHEANMKFDEAIDCYIKSLRLKGDQPQVKRKLDSLRKAWNAATPEHRAARAFFQKTWPGLSWREMRDKFEECEKQMEVIRKVGDYLTARMILKANTDMMEKLRALLANEKPNEDEGNTKAADIEDLLLKLRDQNNDLIDFIRNAMAAN